MELIAVPLAFLEIISCVILAMGILVFIAIVCIFVGVYRACWRHSEEYLSPVTKEARKWKDKVDEKI